MYNPVSTYRIQFHEKFTFTDFERIIPYLQKLGINTVYASPIFQSSPGSTHGYDGVNPHEINPEIGTLEQLKDLSSQLKELGINWVQDIVPNHMAFTPDNPWLMDVMEKGKLSKYASFFDIAWNSQLYHGRLMVPFLGATLEDVIKNKEVKVIYQPEKQRLALDYYDTAWPLHLRSYATILQAGTEKPNQALETLLTQIQETLQVEEPQSFSQSADEIRLQLASLLKNDVVSKAVETSLEAINKNPEELKKLAGEQVYHLCHWQETDKQINFRRFFTVNSLICLNIQEPEVFAHYHQLIKSLVEEGIFQGLRIDHIDGLYDPKQYLDQLRELVGDETYIVVEKILEPGEVIPPDWSIQGNTGYDFLAIVNNLFTQPAAEKTFSSFYRKLIGSTAAVEDQIHEKKANILNRHMAGELDNLYHLFQELNLVEKRHLASIHPTDIKTAIGEVMVHCPVYRYYGNSMPLSSEEANAVQKIINNIKRNNSELSRAVSLLEMAILHKPNEGNAEYNKRALQFYQRLMQFTGPLMAKGVEDTLMYTYNRFIGHNEVGDAPDAFGHTPEKFHQIMVDRQTNWPLSINGTSTHDTKRGEDARARLNVLTDLAAEWQTKVKEWQGLTAAFKQNRFPDVNDEYFIYQTLVGTYPMPEQGDDDYENRIKEYLQKALREAKRHSNWTTPNTKYEDAAKNFATSLLSPEKPFWESFAPFYKKVADFGIINSLAQVLLKFTCPGVPDVYQGCELWDLSLVDPDNRRAVGFDQREQWLQELDKNQETDPAALLADLWKNRYDARIKLWFTHKLLTERKAQVELFASGDYIPLETQGKYAENVLAFARRYQNTVVVVAVPLHLAALCNEQETDILTVDWADTKIVLPKDISEEYENLLIPGKGKAGKGIAVKDIFSVLPFAVLRVQQLQHERGAGILMHISSLPGPFGIGDMGPEAKNFANFLHHSNQKYWQLLPLSPTEAGQGHSPYSSFSSMAGNTLLISPELLAKDKLISNKELQQFYLPQEGRANYDEAKRVKEEIFNLAWQRFNEAEGPLHKQFADFCTQEAAWLEDFARYVVLKDLQENKAWFQWPDDLRTRQPEALSKLDAENEEALQKTKWLQFIFLRQWKNLKAYCNDRRIQFLGDLPFYVSYDSVDAWANQDIFSLDEAGNMLGVAGVPPDAFSDDGQLWGMPVFRWEVLKEQGYKWWINRLRKNCELFDLVRLDHFRAFADYWEVPATEKTARNGKWVPGPGPDFFATVQRELGNLPYVAEDLGEINEPVLELRDEFKLPGMKILHFAFGGEMPQSDYIPHNYQPNFIAYTGTHDNNTTRGWFRQEASPDIKKTLNQYVGMDVNEDNVHYVLGRLAYASVAKTAILPIQDVLGLNENARMNIPGSVESNWAWRLQPGQLTHAAEHLLKEWTWLFNRG